MSQAKFIAVIIMIILIVFVLIGLAWVNNVKQ